MLKSTDYTVAEPRQNTRKDTEVSWNTLTNGHPVLKKRTHSGNGKGKECGNV